MHSSQFVKFATFVIFIYVIYATIYWGLENRENKVNYQKGPVCVIYELLYDNKYNVTYYSLEYNFTDYEIIKMSNCTVYSTTEYKFVNPASKRIVSDKPYVSKKYILFQASSYLLILAMIFSIVIYGLRLYEKKNYILISTTEPPADIEYLLPEPTMQKLTDSP